MQASSGSVSLEATEDRIEVGQRISFGCVEMGSSICARADNTEEESFFDSLEAALDPETDAHEVGSSTREGYFTVSLSEESVLDGRHASTDPTLDAQPINAVAVVPQAQSPAHDSGAVALSTSRGEVPLDKLRLFCSNVLLTLAPPLLKEVQSSQSLGLEADEGTPRRITRSGARQLVGKPPKKASMAETVLLKALGITPNDLEVDERALQEFRGMFDLPLQEQQLRVIAAIFGKVVPQEVLELASTPGGISAH
jgi:hypothetical protein